MKRRGTRITRDVRFVRRPMRGSSLSTSQHWQDVTGQCLSVASRRSQPVRDRLRNPSLIPCPPLAPRASPLATQFLHNYCVFTRNKLRKPNTRDASLIS
ncbi:hypothetical protein E2C01_006268 [Portunus trituberculatus]|uniref:Uncharacterized protein n=1 Tax=Portunus trituberculatus TaxID=210409 RepID=A0A5B7CVW4_PORTR|nr:hypothetical protein [Portunus trituberculatus]